MKILQFSSPLFFLNKELFQESVRKKTLGQRVRGPDAQERNVERIIIDCSAMSFIDSAGVEALAEVPTTRVTYIYTRTVAHAIQ